MVNIDINIGDEILVGRFKNKRIKVKDIGIDQFGAPTVNGKGILKVRIPKLYLKKEDKMKNSNVIKLEELLKSPRSYKYGQQLVEMNSGVYFSTFTAAVQYARTKTEQMGYELSEDDWFNKVNVGSGRPKEGQTFKASIELIKNGKIQTKQLQIQVYNRGNSVGNNYELNMYIQ